MIKFRLGGSREQIEHALKLMEKDFFIKEVSEPIKNRNSNFYRVYATVMILEGNDNE